MEKNSKEISTRLSEIKEEDLATNIFRTCLESEFPVAFWKLPGSDQRQVLVEFTSHLSPVKLSLDSTHSGFAFAPFVNPGNKNTLLIKPDFYYNFTNQQLTLNNSFEKEKFITKFLTSISGSNPTADITHLPKSTSSDSANKDQYKNTVTQALKAIQENEFKKVVLARKKGIALPENFDPVKAFDHLCKDQFNSFVSLVFIPQTGLWIGASPELLVSINKQNIFKTTSLAGTQKFQEGEELSNAVWTQKEIEEQALVSRYIISCFKTIRLREYEEDGPKTVRAGNMIHLQTDFLVDINEVNFSDLGTVMLDLLHPTSAVCGMPKEGALTFINSQEQLDRKFYSGFIGPVNIDHESHIFVNIRCAEIGSKNATLYSGAGITAGSNPDKEFDETELKMGMMESILNFEF